MPGMLLPLLLATSPGSRHPADAKKQPFCSRTSSKENNHVDQTQVSLAQSGMGLASVDQEWSWILPNLVVKDQVFFCHIITRVILVNMVISVILGHEKTKIHNIIDYGKIDVFSVGTNIYIKNKKMGHLIWPFGVLLYKTFQKWDVPRWRKAGWMIVVTCQTHFFCNTGTILAR